MGREAKCRQFVRVFRLDYWNNFGDLKSLIFYVLMIRSFKSYNIDGTIGERINPLKLVSGNLNRELRSKFSTILINRIYYETDPANGRDDLQVLLAIESDFRLEYGNHFWGIKGRLRNKCTRSTQIIKTSK
jgi:hypothetical protein